jgi:hypothetical protein
VSESASAFHHARCYGLRKNSRPIMLRAGVGAGAFTFFFGAKIGREYSRCRLALRPAAAPSASRGFQAGVVRHHERLPAAQRIERKEASSFAMEKYPILYLSQRK